MWDLNCHPYVYLIANFQTSLPLPLASASNFAFYSAAHDKDCLNVAQQRQEHQHHLVWVVVVDYQLDNEKVMKIGFVNGEMGAPEDNRGSQSYS